MLALALALVVAPGARAAVAPPALPAPPAPPAAVDRDPDAEALLRRALEHRRAAGGTEARWRDDRGVERRFWRQHGVGLLEESASGGTVRGRWLVIGEQAWERREDERLGWVGPLPPPAAGWPAAVAAIDAEALLGLDALDAAIREARFLRFIDGGPGTAARIEGCAVRSIGLVRRLGEMAFLQVCPDDGQLLRAELRGDGGQVRISYADVAPVPLLPPEAPRPPPAR